MSAGVSSAGLEKAYRPAQLYRKKPADNIVAIDLVMLSKHYYELCTIPYSYYSHNIFTQTRTDLPEVEQSFKGVEKNIVT